MIIVFLSKHDNILTPNTQIYYFCVTHCQLNLHLRLPNECYFCLQN
uniref:Uncharacterized protein n=1 Tax=Anguilla anguilla TaxID=7936 RepID=A0A0E9SDW4_ANGAN